MRSEERKVDDILGCADAIFEKMRSVIVDDLHTAVPAKTRDIIAESLVQRPLRTEIDKQRGF